MKIIMVRDIVVKCDLKWCLQIFFYTKILVCREKWVACTITLIIHIAEAHFFLYLSFVLLLKDTQSVSNDLLFVVTFLIKCTTVWSPFIR